MNSDGPNPEDREACDAHDDGELAVAVAGARIAGAATIAADPALAVMVGVANRS